MKKPPTKAPAAPSGTDAALIQRIAKRVMVQATKMIYEANHRDDIVTRSARALAEKAGHIVANLEAHVNLTDTGPEAKLAASGCVWCELVCRIGIIVARDRAARTSAASGKGAEGYCMSDLPLG